MEEFHARRATSPVIRLAWLTLALVVLSFAATGLLAVRVDLFGRPAFVFLIKNLVLAWIPFLLALGLAAVHHAGRPRPVLWLLGAGWLLFLPNAPYILTDFVHLGQGRGAPLWFDAALLGTFACAGLALGLASLLVVHHVVDALAGRLVGWAVAVTVLVLSAAGVYLGRFPRFNSLDVVFDPGGLLAVVRQRAADPLGNPLLVQFGAAMSALLLGCYLLAWLLERGLLGPVDLSLFKGRLGPRPEPVEAPSTRPLSLLKGHPAVRPEPVEKPSTRALSLSKRPPPAP